MATITYTVTVRDEDGVLLSGATVKIFDVSRAVIVSGTTNGSGVISSTVASSDPTPALWKFVVSLTGYFKAAGYMIFTDTTTCSTSIYLLTDPDTATFVTGVNSTAAELNTLAGVTAGTVTASKAVVVDASKDISSFRDVALRNLDAGASGTAGSVDIFPTTASKGKTSFTSADNSGDTTTTITVAAQAGAVTYTIPDAGASASFIMTALAQTMSGAKTFTGGVVVTTANVTITDVDIVLSATTGTKFGTATTQKLSFYNATPIVRPSAYTQTYSTADKTMANVTATILTDNTTGSANTTLEDLVSGTVYATDVGSIRNNFADLAASVNALIVDLADVKQAVNSLIDDLQALGLVG